MNDKKYKLGYAPGVYDLFHIGHLNLIRRAKELSGHLLVGVLSDELVEHFKGKRPFIPFEDRIAIVEAIREVDEVVKVDFSNTVKMRAWELYHYDAYFSGNDHQDEWERERQELRAVGSDIVYLPYTQKTSSTKIKQQLREAEVKKRLYLFGSGRIGQGVLKEWQNDARRDRWEIAGFLDNQTEKRLTRIQGVPVYSPEDLKTLESDDEEFAILITMKEKEEAEAQLERLGMTGNLI